MYSLLVYLLPYDTLLTRAIHNGADWQDIGAKKYMMGLEKKV